MFILGVMNDTAKKPSKPARYFKKILKIFLWIFGSIVALFLLIVGLLQIPYFQNIAKDQLVSYLEKKIGTTVSIGYVEIGLPKKVILKDVYFQSQQHDTLLAGKELAVDISLTKLLSNEVEINSVNLKGITAKVNRNQQGVFNFDYIIKAFDSGKPKDTTSAPMKFSIEKVNLDNISLKYDDDVTGNYLTANITHFDTRFKEFNLNTLAFNIPAVTLHGAKVRFKQSMVDEIVSSTQKVAEEASKKPNLSLVLNEINLENIDIGYDNQGSKLDTGLKLVKLQTKVNEVNLKTQLIDLQSLTIKDLNGTLAMGTPEKTAAKTLPVKSTAVEKASWKFKLGKTDISNVNFKYDDLSAVAVKKGIDYKHLKVTNLDLKANNFSYKENNISGDIQQFSVKEKSGVHVKQLQTNFSYTARGAKLLNLYLETPDTKVTNRIAVSYPSLANVNKNIGKIGVNANFTESHVGFKDVLLFAPNLINTAPFKENPDGQLYIDGTIIGLVSDLKINGLKIYGIGNTTLAASGRIKGLPDAKKAYFDLDIQELNTTAKDIKTFVPEGTLPGTISIPERIALKGTFKGTLNKLNTNLNLNSSYGTAALSGTFDQSVKNREKYDATVNLGNFDLGRLIKNDSLGKISLNAHVKGTGLNPERATAAVKGTVTKAEYNGYTYKNLSVNGKINNGKFDAKAGMKDPNIDFALDAAGGFKGKFPYGKVHLNIDIIDLEKLRLHAGPLKLRGNVDADISDANPDNLNGKVAIHHFIFANEKEQFAMDSVKITAISTADTTAIKIDSQFLKANATGKYKVTALPAAIQRTVAKFYNTGKVQKLDKPENPQQITFSLKVDNDPILTKILPELKRFEPIDIDGYYSSKNDSLVINANIPRIVYGNNTVNGVTANIATKDTAMVYAIRIDALENSSFRLGNTTLQGDIKDNVVNYRLEIDDQAKKQQYMLAGKLEAKEQQNQISLNPDGLMLNYEEWTVAQDNLLRFGKDGFFARNFEISNNDGALKLNSESEQRNSPLNVSLENFTIETLTNAVQKEETKFKGTINGTARVTNITTKPVFESQLDITDFAVAKDTVGNIKINVNNKVANTFTADVAVTGNGNQLNLNGDYNTSTSGFKMMLNIEKFNMTSVQALSFGSLKDSDGYVSGQFNITGTAKDPNIVGDLKFNEVSFRVTQLNALYKGINKNISFTKDGIAMNNFTIEDENNNLLTLNGNIATNDYRKFGFNLTIDAENFRAINSKAKDNDFYYGDLYLDANLKLKGTLENPVVNGSINVNEDTNFTVVLPQQDPRIADREGVVEFVDEDNQEALQRLKIEQTVNKSALEGLDVSLNIGINKEATTNLIVDKGNGDYLELKGEAQLTGGIDPSGKTTLTGRYEFNEGAYQMSFNFIKRKFDIQKGSYILWTGEPTAANLNITAVYQTETSPIDLVLNQISGKTQSEINTYKQKIPVNTLLKINGELLKPELSFDIQIPDGNYNVSADIIETTNTKLEEIRQQPSELNKQVLALLLLNRFIGENPFSSEAGGTSAEALARQSVSKILSQQLNNLASDLIKGVELNFDLESTEDYTTGEQASRTDLNVGVSKTLFDDRLKVTVGSSFGLEGPQQPNQQTTNIAGDVSVDYRLTQDGRYLVRAFRKNEYQVALQGQVIETGVSFVITMSYDKFRELFHRTPEEREMLQRERERRAREKEEKNREKTQEEQKKAAGKNLPPNSTNNEDN